MQKTPKQNRLKVIALAASLAFSPMLVNAAGLGRITVLSALGQPLRAELEITANKDELSSLSARLASAEAFRIAGIEYITALTTVHFSRDIKERNGKRFLEISSDRPVNEPFIDMLIELNWSSGRLVREYTFLLDPPDLAQKAPPVPVAPPAIKAIVPAPAMDSESSTVRSAPLVSSPPARATMSAEAPLKAAPVLRKAAPEQSAAITTDETSSRRINSGDTLGKIAQETRPDGVSLDQMLLALFRSNADAFDGNMNRMRAGRILKVPDANTVRAIDAADAHREVVAQSADFNAYRRKLAELASSAPASSEQGSRVAAGKITSKVVDKAPVAVAGKDKLEVSRTETAAVKPDAKGASKQAPLQGRLSALEEDLVSRERALNEAGSRIAQLEKNLVDLKKLAEMKSEAGAAMQKQAEAAKAPIASPPPPALATPAAATPPIAPTPSVAAAPVPPVAESAPPKPAAETEKPAPDSAKAPPPPPKKKLLPPPEPVPEPDFLEENAPLVFGGAGVLALLLGYLGFSAYRRKKKQVPDDVAPLSQADLSTNSVFSDAASESVNVTAAAPGEFSISESTIDSGAEVVDPLVEADTYLAFGRDAQAEEILLDALQKEPTRHAIHLKLLEIYSARRSPMQFNTLARELHDQTGGQGSDWDRAQAMGHALDSNNPLYQLTEQQSVGSVSPAGPVLTVAESAAFGAVGAVATVAAVAVEQEAQTRPDAVDPDATMVFAAPINIETLPASSEPVPVVAEDIASLDFDLDLGETPVATAEVTPVETALKAPSDSGLDFDLDLDEPAPSPDAKTSAEAATSDIAALDIDFDLNMPDEAVAPASGSQDSNAISFDLDLPTESQALALDINVEPPVTEVASVLANEAPVLPVAADANNIDFALDLELPEVSQATEIIPNEVTLEPLADEPVPAVPKMDDAASIDFDFDLDLGESTPPVDVADVSDSPLTTVAERGTELPEPQSFAPPLDLGSISLDLDSPEPTPVPEPLANAGVIEDAVPDNPESATKLELALAYEEMGDSDGARELLEEVLKEGSPGQREAAQAKLDTLG